MSKEERVIDKGISDIVGAITDPIIVWPGGWGDTLPDYIKTEITLERLVENLKALKGEQPTGTDAEACAYLYTLNLCQPMDHDWIQIYAYLVGRVRRDAEMPADLRVEALTDQQQRELRGLKDFIYRKRVEARQEKDRERRREEKKTAQEVKEAENPRLF